MEIHSGHENKSWWERVGQAESVEKSWKTWKLAKLAKFRKITTLVYATSSPIWYFFRILVTLPIFLSSWKTTGGRSSLYQTWYGPQWFYMITTKHGFSLISGFTKIWSPPYLPLPVKVLYISNNKTNGKVPDLPFSS